MFEFLMDNDLISPNQLGFKPEDSRINQILSITIPINLLVMALKLEASFSMYQK